MIIKTCCWFQHVHSTLFVIVLFPGKWCQVRWPIWKWFEAWPRKIHLRKWRCVQGSMEWRQKAWYWNLYIQRNWWTVSFKSLFKPNLHLCFVSRYNGEWVEGVKQGSGSYLYASGDVFEGNYENNQRHGPGTLKKADGEVREENWKEDKLTSYNTIKEKDAK